MPVAIVVALVLLALYVISLYNGLQQLKTQIVASIQEIGNQLKRQISLIPNLESAVKGYMKHEKGVFEMLTAARTQMQKAEKSGKMSDLNAAAEKLEQVLPQIKIVVESNPELKADATVTQFMNELTDTADKLMYARRSLIDLSQRYNARLVTFPSNLVANALGFKPEAGLNTARTGAHVEVSNSDMREPTVTLDK